MRLRSTLFALAACSGPPREPIAHHVEPARDVWIHRKLHVGMLRGHSQRATFELTFDGDRATLVETDAQAPRAKLEETERATWEVRSTRTYAGTRRSEGGAVMLDLASSGVQPLRLRCTAQAVQVAAAGARRVPSPDRGSDYACGDPGVWEPRGVMPVDALVCGEATHPVEEDDGGGDDDDRLVFGRAPGIEWAFVNDGCGLQGGGLRRAR